MGKLEGRTVAFLAAEGVEQVEVTEPWKAVEDAGGTPRLISLDAGHVQAFNHIDRADTFPVDATIADAEAGDYDALVLGGSGDRPVAILDIDGTLVDTNYHHAIAWYRAMREHGAIVPMWRLHRHIGMGGDLLVGAVAGEDFEREHGDAVRESESEHYMRLIEEAEPLAGAKRLIEELRRRGVRIVLASSAKEHEVEHYVGLLGAEDLDRTNSGDVEASKPEPDLVEAALARAGGGDAIMVGDSVWDCEAAARAGVRCVAVLTGGFSASELEEAGAEAVFESIEELVDALDRILEAAAPAE